jgi:hypothetical protein
MRRRFIGPQSVFLAAVFLSFQIQTPDLVANLGFGGPSGQNKRDFRPARREDHRFRSRWPVKNLALGNDPSFHWVEYHNLSTAGTGDRISRWTPREAASDSIGEKADLSDRAIKDVDPMQLRQATAWIQQQSGDPSPRAIAAWPMAGAMDAGPGQ